MPRATSDIMSISPISARILKSVCPAIDISSFSIEMSDLNVENTNLIDKAVDKNVRVVK